MEKKESDVLGLQGLPYGGTIGEARSCVSVVSWTLAPPDETGVDVEPRNWCVSVISVVSNPKVVASPGTQETG